MGFASELWADRTPATKNPGPTAPAYVQLRCPECGVTDGYLHPTGAADVSCLSCGFIFETRDGILRALPANRQSIYLRFIEEYSFIRRAESRGSEAAAYYLALPYQDQTGKNSEQWLMRARTYRSFERQVLPQFEGPEGLHILDLGAGTGWLSYRLALRHHQPVAVDILTDSRDGLGAARHYEAELGRLFPLVAAEFDNLPFAGGQFDLVIFNSSLHYSTDYFRTLAEAKRCLRAGGGVIILDSPIYRCREHGQLMLEERHRYFAEKYGFRSDSIPSIEFLDEATIEALAGGLRLTWRVYRPWYGWKWHLRPWRARLSGARPPSRFHILVGRFAS